MARPRREPRVNHGGQKELDKVKDQIDEFDKQVKSLSENRDTGAPMLEQEPQVKLSNKEIDNMKFIYLKRIRSFPPPIINIKTGEREIFNEKFRKQREFLEEKVTFTACNRELIGETLELWTKPFGGMDCEEWAVPANKPVVGPRYLAEQIKRKWYNRIIMDEKRTTGADGMGSYYGAMTVAHKIPRLECNPVTTDRSVFMNASSF